MQEVDGENEATKEAQDALILEETADGQEVTSVENDSGTGLTSSCIVSVMMESSSAVTEEEAEGASGQNLGHVEAVECFSVPDVLQQTPLVAEAYESTMDMVEMVEKIPETET